MNSEPETSGVTIRQFIALVRAKLDAEGHKDIAVQRTWIDEETPGYPFLLNVPVGSELVLPLRPLSDYLDARDAADVQQTVDHFAKALVNVERAEGMLTKYVRDVRRAAVAEIAAAREAGLDLILDGVGLKPAYAYHLSGESWKGAALHVLAEVRVRSTSFYLQPEVSTHWVGEPSEVAKELASLREDQAARQQRLAELHMLGADLEVDEMTLELLAAPRDLLLRPRPPLGAGGPLQAEGEDPLQASLRIARALDVGVLPVQGPPGAGKTYTGSSMIAELVGRGRKVGIVANSHAVVRNLIDAVIERADELGVDLACVQKPSTKEPDRHRLRFAAKNADLLAALGADCRVAGATAWLWSSTEAFEAVDVLFVDEAAQMSLANVLAVSQAAKAVVLLGDPRQLDQPMQGSHPEGTDTSALDHILAGTQTIEADRGLFLGETWRLHPSICEFTSEQFYEGKLHSRPELERQRVNGGRTSGSGLRYLPVEHIGNHNCSPEEADVVADLVRGIVEGGVAWIDRDGVSRDVGLEDVLVITPYNAQVFEIQQRLPGARVGTVDKFQCQEAPVAIYSLATSSHADAPRGMEFLYSLNRLNVATSRARCLSYLVCSPAVFDAPCRSPRQMQLANAFCRYLELAA